MYELRCLDCGKDYKTSNPVSMSCGCGLEKHTKPGPQRSEGPVERVVSVPRQFLDDIFNIMWNGGDMDGGTLQELGEKHGLLNAVRTKEPCGEHCRCSEFGFPQDCIQKAY